VGTMVSVPGKRPRSLGAQVSVTRSTPSLTGEQGSTCRAGLDYAERGRDVRERLVTGARHRRIGLGLGQELDQLAQMFGGAFRRWRRWLSVDARMC